LIGGAGGDSVYGGNGHDLVEFACDSVDYISGDSGNDTIEFVATEALDFANNTLATIDYVEIFNLADGDQDVVLNGTNIGDFVTGTNNVADNTDYQGKRLLVVDSTAGSDSLELTGGNWVDTGDVTSVNGSGSFSVYHDTVIDVYVATDLTATLS